MRLTILVGKLDGDRLIDAKRLNPAQLAKLKAHWQPARQPAPVRSSRGFFVKMAVATPDEQLCIRWKRVKCRREVARLFAFAPIGEADRFGLRRLRADLGFVGDQRPAEIERCLNEGDHLWLTEVADLSGRELVRLVGAGSDLARQGFHRQKTHSLRVRARQNSLPNLARADAAAQPVVRLIDHDDTAATAANRDQFLRCAPAERTFEW